MLHDFEPSRRVAEIRARPHHPVVARTLHNHGLDLANVRPPTRCTTVLEEIHEPLEEGLIGDDALRDLVFTNPVRLWTATNRHYFDATVEGAVRDLLPTTRGTTR